MMYEKEEDIIAGEFHCPRCGEVMREKKPTYDRFLIKDKAKIVRLLCLCGHYEDKIVTDSDQFYEKNNSSIARRRHRT